MLASGGGKIMLSDVMAVPYWVAALVLAALLVAVLVGLERWRPWRNEIGREVDGDVSATATFEPRSRLLPAE